MSVLLVVAARFDRRDRAVLFVYLNNAVGVVFALGNRSVAVYIPFESNDIALAERVQPSPVASPLK